MNNDPTAIISKILRTRGLDAEPDALLYLLNEIKNNKGLLELYKKNPQEYAMKINDNRFLEMLFNKYSAEKKDKERDKERDRERDKEHDKEHDYDDIKNTISDSRKDLAWLLDNKTNDNYVKTDSDQTNIFPDIDDIYMYMYDLTLNLTTDLAIDDLDGLNSGNFQLQFIQHGNISKIKINSFTIPYNDYIKSLPYIYVKIAEIKGRCFDSKKNSFFGKLILKSFDENYMIYVADYESCIQVFSNPIELNKFSLTFYDNKNQLINLQQIMLSEIDNDKQHLILRTEYNHNLKQGETIVLYVIRDEHIEIHELNIKSILNDKDIVVDKIKDITENVEMYRRYLPSNITFRLYELNYNLISGKDKNNIHIINLNNMVNKLKRKSIT